MTGPVTPTILREWLTQQLADDELHDQIDSQIDEHRPAEDWHCSCGVDLFGGSASYSWSLFRAHLADAVLAAIVRHLEDAA